MIVALPSLGGVFSLPECCLAGVLTCSGRVVEDGGSGVALPWSGAIQVICHIKKYDIK